MLTDADMLYAAYFCRWALPEPMAQAGFYYQPSSTGDDRAMCFTCNVCLVCWEPTDEPWFVNVIVMLIVNYYVNCCRNWLLRSEEKLSVTSLVVC